MPASTDDLSFRLSFRPKSANQSQLPPQPLIPLPPKAYLRRCEPATTASVYVVPDTAREKPVEAEVIAIPTVPYINEFGSVIPCPVAPGQRVLVGKYAGDYKFRGEDITIVRWDEILAIIPDALIPDTDTNDKPVEEK